MVRAADWVVNLGAEGGTRGGRLVFAGTPAALLGSQDWGRRDHTRRSSYDARKAPWRRRTPMTRCWRCSRFDAAPIDPAAAVRGAGATLRGWCAVVGPGDAATIDPA